MNIIKKLWYLHKLKKERNDLYWIQAELRGLEPSEWSCILAMNEVARLKEIKRLEIAVGQRLGT